MDRNAGRRALGNAATALGGDGKEWVLLSVAFGWFLVLGTRFVVPALLPQIKADFAIDNATAGLAITVLWAAYSLMQFPSGLLVDRFGERDVLVVSLTIGGVSLLFFGIAPIFALFLLVCVTFGLGTGLFGTPRATVISNTYREHDSAAFGVILASGSIGSAALPFLATILVTRMTWSTIFIAFVPWFLLVAAVTWWAIPRRTTGFSPPSLRETPGQLRAQVTHRPVIGPVIAVTIMVFIYQGLTAFLPVYLIATKDLAQGTAGALYALFFVTAAVVQPAAGNLADRYGSRPVLIGLTAFSVLPLIALPFVTGLVPLGVLLMLIAIRLGVIPVNNAYVVDLLPDHVQGSVWGLFRLIVFSIGALGSSFVGLLADYDYFDEAFVLLGVLTAVAAGLYWGSVLGDTD